MTAAPFDAYSGIDSVADNRHAFRTMGEVLAVFMAERHFETMSGYNIAHALLENFVCHSENSFM